MKKILFILTLVVVLVGCNSKDATAEKNKILVEKYVKAVENFDFNIMEEMLDDSYVGNGPSNGDSIDKKGAIENWKYNIENLYKKIEYKKSRTIAVSIDDGENQGDWVSNWAKLTITYNTDDEATVWANTIYQIKNEKIVKSYTFYNEADVLEQLGFIFVNPYNK